MLGEPDQRECPSCAFEVDADAEVCPYCGYEFPARKPSFSPAAWLFVLLMLLPVLWVLMRLF